MWEVYLPKTALDVINASDSSDTRRWPPLCDHLASNSVKHRFRQNGSVLEANTCSEKSKERLH